jgi:hypothetical protein
MSDTFQIPSVSFGYVVSVLWPDSLFLNVDDLTFRLEQSSIDRGVRFEVPKGEPNQIRVFRGAKNKMRAFFTVSEDDFKEIRGRAEICRLLGETACSGPHAFERATLEYRVRPFHKGPFEAPKTLFRISVERSFELGDRFEAQGDIKYTLTMHKSVAASMFLGSNFFARNLDGHIKRDIASVSDMDINLNSWKFTSRDLDALMSSALGSLSVRSWY